MQVVHGSSHERFGKKAEEQEGVTGAPRRSFGHTRLGRRCAGAFPLQRRRAVEVHR